MPGKVYKLSLERSPLEGAIRSAPEGKTMHEVCELCEQNVQ